jgi:pyrimidine-nucleoside phosphorylase/thymidine phosphorylase
MVSGRGLGHTGGTLDKLEAIPGFRVNLSLSEYQSVAQRCGLVLVGQTDEIAPADRRLYALRDTTATVESIPLITASILSKKLAEGIDGLVLDVKTGDGAFMKNIEEARTLARTMCAIGRGLDVSMVALITRMDQPLGRAVGNAVEVAECLECLHGRGPSDLVELSIELAAEMLVLGNVAHDLAEARNRCRTVIENGAAFDRFRQVVHAQGGDLRAIEDPMRLPQPRFRIELPAPQQGFLTRISAYAVGIACMRLGAGRARVDSAIDSSVGVIFHKKVGEQVSQGEPICTVLANDEVLARNDTLPLLRKAISIADKRCEPPAIIVERV